MKLPRRRYWVPFLLLVTFICGVRLDLDYHVLGLFRGDAYYRGMPTSFWRDVATHYTPAHETPRWFERYFRRQLPSRGPTTIFQGDPAAQSVLRQLALDAATDRCLRLRSFEKCIGPPLGDEEWAIANRHLSDDDRDIRHAAADLMLRLNKSEAALALLLQELLDEFCDSNLTKYHRAWWSLGYFPRNYPFVEIGVLEKRIVPLLQHQDHQIRRRADNLLKKLAEVKNKDA